MALVLHTLLFYLSSFKLLVLFVLPEKASLLRQFCNATVSCLVFMSLCSFLQFITMFYVFVLWREVVQNISRVLRHIYDSCVISASMKYLWGRL